MFIILTQMKEDFRCKAKETMNLILSELVATPR
jgi:hypothetical protein